MAINQLKSTNINGTLTVNGVAVDAATQAADIATLELFALAIAGVDETTEGIVGGDAWLAVAAQTSPDLTVKISTGSAFIAGALTSSPAVAVLSGFAAPATNPRIDIVQISNAGVVSRKAGTEDASPSVPSADTDNIKLAEVYNRVGQTSIKDTDDASNGYITNNGTHL